MMGKAFFLDRDGVLIRDKNYLSDPAQVEFCPGVPEALQLIHESGYLIVGVSNQSGIARGYFTFDDLSKVQERIDALLKIQGIVMDAWYYCPHHKKGAIPEFAFDCDCRKPKPGLLLQAARELDIDLSRSFMIGDKASDLEAGKAAGCRGVALVRTGQGGEAELAGHPDASDAETIMDAVKILLGKYT